MKTSQQIKREQKEYLQWLIDNDKITEEIAKRALSLIPHGNYVTYIYDKRISDKPIDCKMEL